MPFVYGFLRKVRRHGWRPGRPDVGLPDEPDEGGGPDEDEDLTPPWGIEEGNGDGEEIQPPRPRPPIPRPPVGIWPPMRPEDPWRPVPPEGWERPERPSFPERPGQGLPPNLPQPPAGGVGGRPPERPGGGGGSGGGGDEHPDTGFPPGAIWPPLPPGVHGKYVALVLVGGMPGVKYRYVIIDADAKLPELPDKPAGGWGGRPPQRPGPGEGAPGQGLPEGRR